MQITDYFIKHPVIAIILNILLMTIGLLCLNQLSVREYPKIVYPTINVSASYPNASPEVIESSVTNVLEDQLAGIEGVESIKSISNAGSVDLTLLFRAGTNMDRALSSTQDAVGVARGLLPIEVKSPIVEATQKSTGLPFIGISVSSDAKSFGELTHFANLHLKNVLRSAPGVASIKVWGQPYTYNVELDPQKLYAFGVNPDEVSNAIKAGLTDLPAGQFRERIPVTLNKTLKKSIDFDDLIVKRPKDAPPVKLSSIAATSIDTEKNLTRVRVNGHTGVVLSIERTNESNPIEVSQEIRKVVEQLKTELPEDIKLGLLVDQSDFISASIANIESSIFEAVALVLMIVFIFLRSFKATLIPMVTIPISLLGAVIFLKAFGYSINMLTLLAMVLAIGLVVDDAIIVLENIYRHIEAGLPRREAALKGAKEIGFPIVAMTLTLASVYFPIAFVPGMLGQLFIEFAFALAGSVIISGLVALTLSPMMCANLLSEQKLSYLSFFDKALEGIARGYHTLLTFLLPKRKSTLMVALLSIVMSGYFYLHITQETAPKEDRSLMGVYIPKIEGVDIDELEKIVVKVEKDVTTLPQAKQHLTFIGSWGGSIVMPLKPQNQRNKKATQLVEQLKPQVDGLPSIDPHVWSWDMALPGISNAGSGSRINMVVTSTDSYDTLYKNMLKLQKDLEESKAFRKIRFDLKLDTLGYTIELDNNAIAALDLQPIQVAKAIEIFFSGDKNLTIEKEGVIYNVTIKGKNKPWSLSEIYLTTPEQKRISLAAIAHMKPQAQVTSLTHYQQMRSTNLYVEMLPDETLAHASKKLWKMVKSSLPDKYKLSWVGAVKSLEESSNTMLFLLIFALVFIYAILAMQFESFIDPFIILFTVPLSFVGALAVMYGADNTLNIYSQVGLITLIGLISKHGILMVEFANQQIQSGLAAKAAIINAAVLRLRPILMTTSAMLLGAIPLVISIDAGAEARRSIGMVLISGLSIGTLFTLFVLPGIYLMIKSINKKTIA